MTETLEKTTTGLPDLPEGYFWRVGKLTLVEFNWSRGKDVVNVVEGVGIIKQKKTIKKTQHPVYGEKWYNSWKKVGSRWEESTLIDEKTVAHEEFDTIFSRNLFESLPVYARDAYENHTGAEPESNYRITYDEAGISFLAGRVYDEWIVHETATREYHEERKRNEANKARLYGDYPPKTLVVK